MEEVRVNNAGHWNSCPNNNFYWILVFCAIPSVKNQLSSVNQTFFSIFRSLVSWRSSLHRVTLLSFWGPVNRSVFTPLKERFFRTFFSILYTKYRETCVFSVSGSWPNTQHLLLKGNLPDTRNFSRWYGPLPGDNIAFWSSTALNSPILLEIVNDILDCLFWGQILPMIAGITLAKWSTYCGETVEWVPLLYNENFIFRKLNSDKARVPRVNGQPFGICIRNHSYLNGMRRNINILINILRQNYYLPYDTTIHVYDEKFIYSAVFWTYFMIFLTYKLQKSRGLLCINVGYIWF